MESLNTTFLPPKSQTPLKSLHLKLQEGASRLQRAGPGLAQTCSSSVKAAAQMPSRSSAQGIHGSSPRDLPAARHSNEGKLWKEQLFRRRLVAGCLHRENNWETLLLDFQQTNPHLGLYPNKQLSINLDIQNLSWIDQDPFGNSHFFKLQSLFSFFLSPKFRVV